MIPPDANAALFYVNAEAETEKSAKDLVTSFVEKIKKWQS